MSEFKVNGKVMTAEELLDYLDQDDSVISSLQVEMNNDEKVEEIPHSDEGFEIPKDVIAELSQKMNEFNAGRVHLTLKNSPYIRGRTLILTMQDPDYEDD